MDARISSCAHQPPCEAKTKKRTVTPELHGMHAAGMHAPGAVSWPSQDHAAGANSSQPSSSRGTHTRHLLAKGNAGHPHAAITHAHACVVCLARGWRVGIGVLATKAPASAHTSSKGMGTYFANVGPDILRPAASGAVACCSLRVGAQGPRCLGL